MKYQITVGQEVKDLLTKKRQFKALLGELGVTQDRAHEFRVALGKELGSTDARSTAYAIGALGTGTALAYYQACILEEETIRIHGKASYDLNLLNQRIKLALLVSAEEQLGPK